MRYKLLYKVCLSVGILGVLGGMLTAGEADPLTVVIGGGLFMALSMVILVLNKEA